MSEGIVSRTRCGVLHAAPQSRDPQQPEYGPRISSAPQERCVRGTRQRLPSQHLMHIDLDAVGVPCADADEQVLHQPAVLRSSGFEFRHRAEIDRARDRRSRLWRCGRAVPSARTGCRCSRCRRWRRRRVSKAYFASSSVKPFGRMVWKSAPHREDRSLDAVAENLAAEDRDDRAGCHGRWSPATIGAPIWMARLKTYLV